MTKLEAFLTWMILWIVGYLLIGFCVWSLDISNYGWFGRVILAILLFFGILHIFISKEY